VVYVAQQLAVSPDALATYGRRIPTRTLHLQHVQAHLGFRTATPLDLYALRMWLVERALEHEKPTMLLQLACHNLGARKPRPDEIFRPGPPLLEWFVATARQQAHEETWHRLTPLVTEDRYGV